ncbi:MAG: sigma-70 family RNA polymerase sigma factor [Actinomycetota bacterium]|nr:sigma-70 family RNA polymerase sigma factor [Actinomycetota bacterium]
MQRFLAGSFAPRRAVAEDRTLVEALRAGDERAFEALVECYHGSLVRIAMIYVGNRAAAEDVAQETWLAVFEGIERFEGRSSLKTWIFRILTNRAKTRGERDRRQIPVSPVGDDDDPEVPLDRFLPADDPKRPWAWASPPRAWPEERLLRRETVERLGAAIAELSPSQQAVIVLRDVEGFSAAEVAAALEISAANERVLLHRARSHVRGALERYFDQ